MSVALRIAGGLEDYLQRRTAIYFLVLALFVMGSAFGAVAVNALSPEQRLDLKTYLDSFFHGLKEGPGVSQAGVAERSFLTNVVKTGAVLWLLGLSVVGIPLVLIVVFTRGFVLGFTVGFLVKEMAYRGIVLAFLSVLPHNLLLIPALIVGGVAAISFALSFLSGRLGWHREGLGEEFAAYTLVMLAVCAAMGAAALVEGFVTPTLLQLVSRVMG